MVSYLKITGSDCISGINMNQRKQSSPIETKTVQYVSGNVLKGTKMVYEEWTKITKSVPLKVFEMTNKLSKTGNKTRLKSIINVPKLLYCLAKICYLGHPNNPQFPGLTVIIQFHTLKVSASKWKCASKIKLPIPCFFHIFCHIFQKIMDIMISCQEMIKVFEWYPIAQDLYRKVFWEFFGTFSLPFLDGFFYGCQHKCDRPKWVFPTLTWPTF